MDSSKQGSGGLVFARALRATLAKPTVWLFVWGFTAVLALVPASARYSWFRDTLANRYEPGELVHSLDRSHDAVRPETSFRTDFADELRLLDDSAASNGVALAALMMIFGVFAAGGWLQVVLERTRGHAMRRFLYGGARYFWRFFRLMLVTLLLLGLFGWVVYETPWNELVLQRLVGLPEFDLESMENLESEWEYTRLVWLQTGLYSLLLALTLTWGDYTRTRLALHNSRSVFLAGLKTFFTMLRHPIKTLRPMLLLVLIELLLVYGAYRLYAWVEAGLVDGPTMGRWVALLAISLAIFAWRTITRGARYHAAAAVSADIVRPLASRPDPWKSSIGGPGGPRYPLEGSDEYGVSL